MTTTNTRIWDNYILRTRYSTGRAARNNRRSYSGQKIHRIAIEEIVGLVDENVDEAVGTLGHRFKMARLRGKDVFEFSSWPLCGCTSGQHAAMEVANATVTCEKCGGGN